MDNGNEILQLDYKAILDYQRNRPPYLLIDYAEEIVPGIKANGYKKLSYDEWFFKCHFPDDPNMPGLLQVEAIVQLCALALLTLPGNKGHVAYLIKSSDTHWKKKVVPGDLLSMKTTVHSFKRGIAECSGAAFVEDQLACSTKFSLALPHLLNGLTPNKL